MTNQYKISDDLYELAMEEQKFGGVKRRQALNWGKSERKIDYKEDFFKPVSGEEYSINILPFIVKSPNHTYIQKGKAKVGGAAYLLDLYEHKDMGANKDTIVCPKMNYGKPCPICEAAEKIKPTDDSSKEQVEEYKLLKAKRRVYLNIQLVDNKGKGGTPKIFSISHSRFLGELLDKVTSYQKKNPEKGPLKFADVEEGVLIEFRCGTGLSKYDITFKDFVFAPRKEAIDMALLEQTVSFDDLIQITSEQEINDILWGTSSVRTEQVATATGTNSNAGSQEDDCPF